MIGQRSVSQAAIFVSAVTYGFDWHHLMEKLWIFGLMSIGPIIQEMRDTLRRNKALLQNRKPYEKWNERTKTKFGEPLKYKEATQAEMSQFRREHEERMRQFRMKKILVVLVSSLLVVIAVMVINSLGGKKVAQQKKNPQVPLSPEFFVRYLDASTMYFETGDYDNAVLYAEYANQCGVEGWYSPLRLAQMYLAVCEVQGTHCKEGEQLANKLMSSYPDNAEIQALGY